MSNHNTFTDTQMSPQPGKDVPDDWQNQDLDTTPDQVNQAPNTELYQNLVSDEALGARKEWLDDHVNGEHDGAIKHVRRLFAQAESQRETGIDKWDKGDTDGYQEHSNRVDDLTANAYRIFGKSTVAEYRHAAEAADALGKGSLQFWGSEAASVFNNLLDRTKIIDDGIDREHTVAPAERLNVTNAEFTEYLGKKTFVDPSLLSTSGRKIELVLDADELYQVPLSNVISANSFDSWAGRGYQGTDTKSYKNNEGQNVKGESIAAITDYALRDTPLPPNEGISAFLQPDGTMLFQAVNSNHRTAAAISRGQDALAVGGRITIYQLDYNVIRR